MVYEGELRKLGFGGMEDTELEEGEAYDYRDADDADDADERIDPDVYLSYLDEKVQNVLGHLQKDFEGGELSAENLGAKFGGYGSFLPSQQRSPSILSHTRNSPNIQRFGTPRSPNSLPSKDPNQKPTVASSALPYARLGPASTSAVLSPVSRGLFVENPQKTDVHQSSSRGSGDAIPKHPPVSKTINSTDQKTLKVRIKMGPDNMSQKTAALYSGLGLDVSPSSSPEDSPNESGGLSPESRDSPDESPTSILQIMTTFPVPGGFLLSPLGDSLLHLTQKKKLLRDGKSAIARKGIQESSSLSLDEVTAMKVDRTFFGETKAESVDRSGIPRDVKNGIVKDMDNEISALLKKEIDIETHEGRELISNSLKLPLLSSSKCSIGDMKNGIVCSSDLSVEDGKTFFKDRRLSSDRREDGKQPMANQDADRTDRPNSYIGLVDKGSVDKKMNFDNDTQYLTKKDGKSKGSKSVDSYKSDADGGKWKNHSDPPKDKISINVTSYEQDGTQMLNKKDHFLPGGKKKSKGSQSNGIPSTEVQNESSKIASSASLKDRKVTSNHSSKSNDESKYRESGKTTESQRGLFADAKVEQAENFVDPPMKEKLKEVKTRVAEKESNQFAEKSRDKPSSKKVNNQVMSEAGPKVAETVPPLSGAGLASDAAAPIVIEENWVCCDKCQKWRLLPYGTNPANLPKKWLCSMLNWLPGKNSCSVSEDETTKALNALYQLPVQDNQSNLHGQFSTQVTFPGTQPIVQMPQENNLATIVNGGKKKQGPKEITNAAGYVGSLPVLSSTKKTQSQSTKSRSLNDMNQSPLDFNLTNKSALEHSSKSSDSAATKRKHKQKEKRESASNEGDARHTKTERKRGHGQGGYESSKKIKHEDMNHVSEDWNFEHGISIGNVASGSVNGFSARESRKNDVQKYNEYSSPKDTKYDATDCLRRSAQKMKESVQVSSEGATQDMRRFEKVNVAMKKRKVDEWQDNHVYEGELLPNNGLHLEADVMLFEEETSGSELKREKKARVSKPDGKSSSRSKGRREMGNEKGIVKDHQQKHNQEGSIESQPILDGLNTLKKDVGGTHSSLAATSSSSKVSGSHRKKANGEEVKGSPVESVSSSPLRIPNPDKVISARKALVVKYDVTNGACSFTDSPRKCLDGEGDCGSDRAGMMSKERNPDVVHCDYQDKSEDKSANKISVSKTRAYKKPPHYEYENLQAVDTGADTVSQHKLHPEKLGKEHLYDDVRVKSDYNLNSGSLSQKSGKGSSSRAKDKQRSSKTEFDKGKIKVSDSFGELGEPCSAKKRHDVAIESHENLNYLDEMRDVKYNVQKKYDSKPGKDERNLDKKHSAGSRSDGKRENQSKLGGRDGSDMRLGVSGDKNDKSYRLLTPLQHQEAKKTLHQSISDGTDPVETSGRGKAQLLPDSGDKPDTKVQHLRTMNGAKKGSGTDASVADASGSGGELMKGTKQPRKSDNQDVSLQFTLRQSTPNCNASGDLDGPVAVRRDSSNQAAAANALKEAKDLKHSADRLKNAGSDLERTGLYFEAALKFLYGASLLEPCNVENAKHGETQSMQVYSSTANLCGFVAHEYERCKELASAALAYKCMEVAYMRVIYAKHVSANRDRNELQSAFLMLPPGESPSSSASDVDNLNNQGVLDKAGLGKGTNSPHVAGNHVIVARNKPNFARLLNFAHDVNSAMEASRKSQNAFAAANVNLEEARYESITSVKRVLDFNFHDVQGLLRLPSQSSILSKRCSFEMLSECKGNGALSSLHVVAIVMRFSVA
ncbi:hypothetical protein Syun_007848 [Stephania yunnanensis]|uniref:CW-type domain-containing protein n=1 Tax=Stephania yunnanensis TaxID=152371 RepID=A0AAP0L0W7_9MAGN